MSSGSCRTFLNTCLASIFLSMTLFLVTFFLGTCQASTIDNLDFTVAERGHGEPVVLVIGGIQGDEPGGFSAAALLSTHYTFRKGTVRIVPNLNFPAIVQRSRGLYGDMNRKFAALSASDPEFHTVRRIQSMITAPDVQLVLNMHDGSGFYRPTHEGPLHNPKRWGQSVIIDQEEWPGLPFSFLEVFAQSVAADVNKRLIDPKHAFYVKNTRTAKSDVEMAKSLTWFALNNSKPAFGLEVSKEFGVDKRAYYHLCMVESFLSRAGVEFERNFPLTPDGVRKALGSDVYVGLADNRLVLPLENVRQRQAGSLPLPRTCLVKASTPIVAVLSNKGNVTVHYGNSTVTSFQPDWMDTDDSLGVISVSVDGEPRLVRFGDMVHARNNISVNAPPNYRVNAIGATLGADENGKVIHRRDFKEQYSVDKNGQIYRVEVYRGELYTGTFLVRYGAPTLAVTSPLPPLSPSRPASQVKESELGW